MGLAAGRLRHRIAIKQQVIVTNSNGDQEKDWVAVNSASSDGKFFAAIEPLSSRELLAAEKSNSEVTCKIVMRYDPRIVASMRAEHSDGTTTTIYNLSAPIRDPDSGLEWMTLPATALLNQG
jgi:SPP1 family predicted phage head-tail adaptor